MRVSNEDVVRALGRLGLIAPTDSVVLSPLTGGVSSEIFRVEIGARVFVVKCALAKLRVAADWQAPRSRNRHEADWLETVAQILPGAVPRIQARDDEAGFFVMEYFDPKSYPLWKGLLRDGQVDLELAAEVGRRLAVIHAETALNAEIANRFATDSIFHAIRLEPYLETAARCHPQVSDQLMTLSRQTLAEKIALVHGDVSPKNILAGPRGPVFLDAECAWFGDPAFDLAFCLNHLLLKCVWNRAAAPRFLAAFGSLAEAYLKRLNWESRTKFEGRTGRLLAALLLARVDGKSPVEYITTEADRELVRQTALPLISAGVHSPFAVQRAWAARLGL